MTKLYVSRYSNKCLAKTEAVKVGISLGAPRFKKEYELAGNAFALAPTRAMFNLDKTVFEAQYRKRLDNLGVERIKSILSTFGYGKEKEMILLCYEDITKPEDWCHRTVFAKWWEDNTGEIVEEYRDDTTYKAKQEERLRIEEEEKNQLDLFGLF